MLGYTYKFLGKIQNERIENIMYRINDYNVNYYEEEKRGYFGTDYIPVVEVYKGTDLVLSSKDKTEEEFLNYLSFLVPEEVMSFVKNKEYLDNNIDSDDEYKYGYDMFDSDDYYDCEYN